MEYEEAAKDLYTSMKGLGTDENRIISIITRYKNSERQLIKQQYVTLYGHQLEDDFKAELSGHFLAGVLALCVPKEDYDAQCIRYAIKGIGTNEKVCINLLCSKEAHEIQALKEAYQRLYQRDLEKDMENEKGGHVGRIFRSLTQGTRPLNAGVDIALAKKEAQELYDAGEGKLGTDELVFIRILCSRSYQQLLATFEEYFLVANNDIERAIHSEMSLYLEKACLAIVKCIRNKPGYFAEQLYDAMKGLGTRDDDLIRLLVSRAEIDLPLIKLEYKRMYNKTLYDAVKSELSGDYEKLFLELIGKD